MPGSVATGTSTWPIIGAVLAMDSLFAIFKDSPYATGPRPVCPVSNVGVLWPNGGWIKMPLGTEVVLGPGDIVLDGDAAYPNENGHSSPPPLSDPYLLWPNGRPSRQLLCSCSS